MTTFGNDEFLEVLRRYDRGERIGEETLDASAAELGLASRVEVLRALELLRILRRTSERPGMPADLDARLLASLKGFLSEHPAAAVPMETLGAILMRSFKDANFRARLQQGPEVLEEMGIPMDPGQHALLVDLLRPSFAQAAGSDDELEERVAAIVLKFMSRRG